MLGALLDWLLSFQVYLPIAEISVSVLLLLGLGGGIGFLSGLFGVGGGFLMTPLLIFIGVPPAVAVATQSNQTVATSVSGVLAHWSRGNVDFKMGTVLLGGGVIGSIIGVALFSILRRFGQIDLVINIAYVLMLGSIGIMMLVESVKALRRVRRAQAPRKLHQHVWVHGLPLKMRFKKSRLYISAVMPVGLGVLVGILSALLGVGGAFMLVPAMIYLLGMPTVVVIGTSLFQIIFVAAVTTVLQSVENRTVDVMLAFVLTIGSVIGAQFGGRIGARLPGEQLRFLLALLILSVAVGLCYELVATPEDLYAIVTLPGSR
ncbi:MAG TPA: sulfite exporter TauE/SafE family protein [Alphaproteobacteria bacterium]|nr:sulfite exporter TauE/SafE family protein [Alphaproteobacteria bacterium]